MTKRKHGQAVCIDRRNRERRGIIIPEALWVEVKRAARLADLNASQYIRRAIQSAISQPEAGK